MQPWSPGDTRAAVLCALPPHRLTNIQEEAAPAGVDDTAPVEDVAAAAAPPQCGDGSNFCAELLPGQMPVPFQISCYGRRLQANKGALAEACAAAGVSPELHALFVAMAMIETNHMCPT
jgi:hypothetical protein